MSRSYHKGVLIGEPDPPPMTSIEEWINTEIRHATDQANVVISSDLQLQQNASLGGRIGALQETLRQLKLRGLA